MRPSVFARLDVRARVPAAVYLAVLASCVVVAGYGLVYAPWLIAGATAGGALVLATMLRPLWVLALLLFIGPIDLSFLTGGFKGLLTELGGLDMNGIRLVGVTAAFSAIALVDRRITEQAFGREGRYFLAFLLFAAFSLTFSPSVIEGVRLLVKLAYPFLLFIVVRGVARDEHDLETLVRAALIGAAVIGLVAQPLWLAGGGAELAAPTGDGPTRLGGVGIHQNPFSFYLLVLLVLSLARFAVRGGTRYLLLSGVLSIWLVLTFTRITLLAAGAALAAMGVLAALRTRGYRAFAGVTLVGLLIALPLVPAALERTLGHVPDLAELVSLATDPVALYGAIDWQGREVFWPVVGFAFLRSPLIGGGMGTSSAVLAEYFPDWPGLVVHNEYLRLAADVGLVGSLLFALAALAWLIGSARAARLDVPLARELSLAAVGGISAWAIIALTDNAFDYYASFTQFVAFYTAGALTLRDRAKAGATDAEAQPRQPVPEPLAPAFGRLQ